MNVDTGQDPVRAKRSVLARSVAHGFEALA